MEVDCEGSGKKGSPINSETNKTNLRRYRYDFNRKNRVHQGLVEGLELNADEKEVKVINAIIGLLDDMALTVSDLEESMNDMGNQLDEVDEDLYYLEQDFYDEDEDDGEDEEYYEVTCPTCNETICVSEDVLLKGGIQCPNCGESLEFDFDDLECDCGCCSDADDEDYCGCGCGEQVEEPIK